MECGKRLPGTWVLIETSWNVKYDFTMPTAIEISVLIETSWNVKVFKRLLINEAYLSINRNIVECKEQECYFCDE